MHSQPYISRFLWIVLVMASASSFQAARGQRSADWLIDNTGYVSKVVESPDGKEVKITNGLIERKFRIKPNFSTVGINNLVTGQSYLRAVRPEAAIVVNGQRYDVGGLVGQPIQNYLLDEWIDTMRNNPGAFQYVRHTIGDIKPRLEWKVRKEWISGDVQWPPRGKELIVEFKPGDGVQAPSIQGVAVKVHYEIYDGLPLICKWITVENHAGQNIMLDRFVSEIMAAVEGESTVEDQAVWELPNFYVETDYAFGGMVGKNANSSAVHWETDTTYKSQVSYTLTTPCLLEIRPKLGPAQVIKPGETFESIRAWELFYDSFDKERKGLANRRMYRTIAPWVTENPVLMHVRKADPEAVKLAVDQCANVGYELVIMTFGSGFDMEKGDPAYYKELKQLADYAHSKGIALGGYSLLASRSIDEKNDVVNPATGKPGGFATFGNSPCLGSEWAKDYFRKITEMYEQTGLDVIEHDGSYPGDVCASKSHPGHTGLDDSQWKQFQVIKNFYGWCRGRGIYLNVPDWYYMNGSSKNAMGYREVNWSLPRAQQEIIERQNIYDGTWMKTSSMGWMFVPLTEYQGGGAAATIEPLSEHLEHYGQRLANLFGAGVQACYRGPRLYDTDSTRALVKRWVDFYKKHRQILDSDIIHLRRPDGKDWDGILHVNPRAKEKGLLMLYNPLGKKIARTLDIPVYYTGLTDKVNLKDMNGRTSVLKVSRDYHIKLPVEIAPRGYAYYVMN